MFLIIGISHKRFCNRHLESCIYSLGHGHKSMLTILPTIWRPGLTTAVCESWNVSDKYTWDNAGDFPWTRHSVRIIRAVKRKFFHMVTNVSDNSNLSQEIFAIYTWRAVICYLGHGRKQMLMILPTILRPSLALSEKNWIISVTVSQKRSERSLSSSH